MGGLRNWYERFVFSPLLNVADRALHEVRVELLGQARGRVLELGIGSGLSLPWYDEQVEEVVGLEPSEALLAQCRKQLDGRQSGPPVTLVQGSAESLSYPDNSFDTVVAFLVFCTIPDPQSAAHEIRRVLRPDGQLLFFEHVQAPHQRLARWQQRLNPAWSRIACGCQLTRETREVFADAGFDMGAVDVEYHSAIPLPLVKPVITGTVTCHKERHAEAP